jgi:prevent-host-death family protein
MPTILTTKTIAAQEARRRFGELLDKADYRRESFLIERAGQAKAAIVPISEYNEMQRMKQEAKKRLFARIDKVQKRLANRDPQKIEAVIQEAIEATRQHK